MDCITTTSTSTTDLFNFYTNNTLTAPISDYVTINSCPPTTSTYSYKSK